MRYSWLFPIAFPWRHFSNEQFWSALPKLGAVLLNQPPDWANMEKIMRSFDAKDVSDHGGLFYSGCVLTEYRFGSAAKPAEWTKCGERQDFMSREILAMKVMWHVATLFKPSYDALQRQPTRELRKACTKDFLKALHDHTKGIFRITH